MAVWKSAGTFGRGPAQMTSRKRALPSEPAERWRPSARQAARPTGWLDGGGPGTEGRQQELLWGQFFRDPTLWWDNRQAKKSKPLPDFRHRESHEVLWLNHFCKPAWVDSKLAALDVEMGRDASKPKLSLPDGRDNRRPAGYDGCMMAETVSKLCHEGLLTEAVEALEVLVRTDFCVPKSLFYTVLKKCVLQKDLALGRRVHGLTVDKGYQSDTFLCNHILRMYTSYGRLQDAMDVFTMVAEPDAFIWSSIISAHVRHGLDKQAVQLYQRMRRSRVKPDGHVFVAALQACARARDLRGGQQVHADVLASGVEPDLFVCNCLVDMYAKCGSLEDAQRVFDGLGEKDVVTWTAMISGYSQQGMGRQALGLYSVMQEEGIAVPNSVTFVCLLQACARVGTPALGKGRQLHEQIRERGHQADVSVANSLVNMYAKCGSLGNAQRVFDRLAQKDVVTWSAMIAGYAQQGMGQAALALYRAMQEDDKAVPDSVIFVCLLQACASVGTPALETGKQLLVQIRERGHQADVFVANSLVNMFAKCGSLEDARSVFDGLGQKNVVTWSSMIAGYTQQGMGQEALSLYNSMQEEGIVAPNSVTLVCLLQACASVGTPALDKGKQLHAQIREQGLEGDVFLASSLVKMYAKCVCLEDAQRVFDGLGQKDVATWTALIAGYSQQGMGLEALRLHSAMQEGSLAVADAVTFVCLLQACGSGGTPALEKGKQLHAQLKEQGLEGDVFVANTLIDMYAKCGSLEDAHRVFHGLGEKDVVTWTAMIAGYSQQGMGQEALHLYRVMEDKGMALPKPATFVCLLQACASVGTPALETGKQLHAQIRERGFQADVFVANSLVNMYAKCGCLEDAQRVFDGLAKKDVVTWSSLIAGYSQLGMGHEALRLYTAMEEENIVAPNSVTFLCLLQACASVGNPALEKGKKLHAQISEQGLQGDVLVGSSLVNMYAKCGSLEDAQDVFHGLAKKDVVTWNTMIGAYSQQGMGQEALSLYSAMQDGMAIPDSVTFSCLLQACASVGTLALVNGKELHRQITQHGHQADEFLASNLVKMYTKCGSLSDAQQVFDGLGQKDVVTWNALIAGYSQQGMVQEALHLYSAMQGQGSAVPDSVTFIWILQACASVGTRGLEKGKQLHMQIKEQGHEADVFVASSLVNMYAKCGSLEEAQRVFDGLDVKDVVTWNAMIAGFSQQGMGEDALHLYSVMLEDGTAVPNSITFLCLLQACASLGTSALEKGKQLHAQLNDRGHEPDAFVVNGLVNMYAKCGSLEDAQRVFDGLGQKDVVTWNSMITGYAQQGKGTEALRVYKAMREDGMALPNSVTFVSLLQACASVGSPALEMGKQLHVQITEGGHQADVFVVNSLVKMYAKCGSLKDARVVFDELLEKDVVTWNAMIAGYSQQGMGQEALRLYSAMKEEGTAVPNSTTFVCLLQACANAAALHLGRQLHEQIELQQLQGDLFVAGSLINMYSKSGSIVDAQQVFEALPERNLVAWNALIAGYSHQGDSEEVFKLVLRMREDGRRPDGITFLSVLMVCSHTGLVAKGLEYFEAMSVQYCITPTVEHYTCMVDLLGRAGQLDEALAWVRTMPVVPDATVWHTVLGACRKWSNVKVGRHAFDQALKLDKNDAAAYVLMWNIYTSAQMWMQAEEMQARRIRIRAWKPPGESWWTDMDGLVHRFLCGERHSKSEDGTHERQEVG